MKATSKKKRTKPVEQTRTTIQKKAMLEALKKTLGVISAACEKVGISRETHYKWKKDDPAYSKAADEIEEYAIDFAEGKLLQRINGGDTIATIFYLKTKGKARGYVERSEVDNNIKTAAPIIIDWSNGS
ncbi:MAG: hypothetical protein IM551_03715 [Chitinophagaceae bacterium]|nr:hypothetical protein [Chitinophagaceae bacterium]